MVSRCKDCIYHSVDDDDPRDGKNGICRLTPNFRPVELDIDWCGQGKTELDLYNEEKTK